MCELYSPNQTSTLDLVNFFEKIFSEQEACVLAKKLKFVQRSRKMLPGLFNHSVINALATDKEWSLYSIYCNYRRLYSETHKDEPLSWEPFYDFLARDQYLTYVEKILELCREKALATKAFSDFSELVSLVNEKTGIDDIIAHDGSVILMSNEALGVENYYVKSPAIKLHASVSLLSFCTIYNQLTPGQADERINLCDEKKPLKNKLFICDAGYCSDNVYEKVISEGGYFLIKLRGNCGFKVESMQKVTEQGCVGDAVNPQVKGKRKNRPLLVYEAKVNEKESYDMIALTQSGIRVRVVKFQIEKDGKSVSISLATNIPADKLDLFQIAAIYRARWQVEIFYRCMKGFCSMKGSRSGNLKIQKAFVLFALITAYLKIIMGSIAQQRAERDLILSPKKLMHKVSPFLETLISKIVALEPLKEITEYLNRCCKEIAATMRKSEPSYINRMRGKSIAWIIGKIKRPTIKTQMGLLWHDQNAAQALKQDIVELF